MIQQTKLTKTIKGANSAVFSVEGMSAIGFQISGTFVATLAFEGTIDGTNWFSFGMVDPSTGVASTSVTATGALMGSCSGLRAVRVRASSFTSGLVSVTFQSSVNSMGDFVGSSVIRATSANTPSIATAATAIAANTSRKGWMIQNVGTNPLFVRLGASASASVFHAVIKGGVADNDGVGASISQMDGAIYTGIITIAGTSPKYVVTEL